MSAPVPNVPYGPGFDEASATAFATELARLCDQLHTLAGYSNDTYSPYSAEEIATYWANAVYPPNTSGEPVPPTDLQLQKANEFKSWIATVQTMIDAAMSGDVGYQIKKWRSGAVTR